MRIVIQCAATKRPTPPGCGFRGSDGRLVKFVARPGLAPASEQISFAHPDGMSDGILSWRQRLLDYNRTPLKNELGFIPAYRLYSNPMYEGLVGKFGPDRVFVLSAGWGLIPADFLTPDYDITFSNARNVAPHCRRHAGDAFADSCLLPENGEDTIFVGGKSYVPLFCRLTSGFKGTKKVFFNSDHTPQFDAEFISERFITTRKTNWHYSCAQALIDDRIGI